MRTVGGRFGLIAAMIAISLGAQGCGGGEAPGPGTGFGRMAGYVWSGRLTSVRASCTINATRLTPSTANRKSFIDPPTI